MSPDCELIHSRFTNCPYPCVMARIDHVVVGVRDLTAATAMMFDRYGLEAQVGGEHPGAGTANMIVPVGRGQFLELMAVIDPTSKHPVAAWLAPLVADGDRLLNIAIEPDDLEATAERINEPTFVMERKTAAGHQLRWRLTGMAGALSPEILPFFASVEAGQQWCTGDRSARHNIEPDGIRWVQIGGDRAKIRGRIADPSIPIQVVDGRAGVQALALGLADQSELELRF